MQCLRLRLTPARTSILITVPSSHRHVPIEPLFVSGPHLQPAVLLLHVRHPENSIRNVAPGELLCGEEERDNGSMRFSA